MTLATTESTYRDKLERVADVLERQLFFVVGCQKSGTTWVQHMLNGHPQVRCHGETYLAALLLPLMQQLIQQHNSHQKAGELGLLTRDEFQTLYATAGGLLFERWLNGDAETVRAIGEKTPEHALCMPALAEAFPNARFIHVIRDGRDVCVSGWFHNQRKAKPQFAQRFPSLDPYIAYTVEQHWVRYITAARAFGEQHPDRYLELRYEQLHEDATDSIRRALTFLGVEDDDDAVSACLDAGAFERLSGGRPRGEADTGSFFRKGVVGDWRQHFSQANRDTFMRHGGDLLRELGYEA